MFEVAVEVGSADAPSLADVLWEEAEALFVSEAGGRVVAGFPTRATAEEVAARVGGTVVDVDATDRRDLDTWRAWARPTRVGRLLVRPAWLPAGEEAEGLGGAAEVEIAIDPGHTFGHGGHPSTRLVLAALVARLRGGESVLDVGCGSGVLSVAAVALGAESATAVDIDPTALAVTRENAERNGLSRRIDVDSTPLRAIRRRFDVTVANIGVVVLRQLAPALAERVEPGGWLALSGLLEHQWSQVVDTVVDAVVDTTTDGRPTGLDLDEVLREDGWAMPILVRAAPPAT